MHGIMLNLISRGPRIDSQWENPCTHLFHSSRYNSSPTDLSERLSSAGRLQIMKSMIFSSINLNEFILLKKVIKAGGQKCKTFLLKEKNGKATEAKVRWKIIWRRPQHET